MIALNDLNIAADLDVAAQAEVQGAGAWHLISRSVSTGSWGAYSLRYKQYKGILFHDGYLSRHFVEGWKRQRTQTEYTRWNHYVRI